MWKKSFAPSLCAAIIVAASTAAAGLAKPYSINGDPAALGNRFAGTLSMPTLSATFDVEVSDDETVMRSDDGLVTATFTSMLPLASADDDVFLLPAGEQLMLGWSHERSDGVHTTLMDLRTGTIVAEMHSCDSWKGEALPRLLMTAIFSQGCDPDFSTCVTAATSACDPLLAATGYSYDALTGRVSCNWKCVTGPGGGGD